MTKDGAADKAVFVDPHRREVGIIWVRLRRSDTWRPVAARP